MCPEWTRRNWSRGRELNPRPLGYEGKSPRGSERDEATRSNRHGDLRHGVVGLSWILSVGLLHSRFIDAAVVAAARAALTNAKLNLGYTRVLAPISGVAGFRGANIGDFVAAADLRQGGAHRPPARGVGEGAR